MIIVLCLYFKVPWQLQDIIQKRENIFKNNIDLEETCFSIYETKINWTVRHLTSSNKVFYLDIIIIIIQVISLATLEQQLAIAFYLDLFPQILSLAYL